jgi:hypothetical protein
VDIDQTKIYAADYMIRILASGKQFNGMGPEAEYLIRATAQGAEENAKLISGFTSRTQDGFFELLDRTRDQFVLEVLGFSDELVSLRQATNNLVDAVWTQYIDWAKEGLKAKMDAVGKQLGVDPETPAGRAAVQRAIVDQAVADLHTCMTS